MFIEVYMFLMNSSIPSISKNYLSGYIINIYDLSRQLISIMGAGVPAYRNYLTSSKKRCDSSVLDCLLYYTHVCLDVLSATAFLSFLWEIEHGLCACTER